MKSRLIIKEAMLLLERNHRIAWHFTDVESFFSILNAGKLKFSLTDNSENEDFENEDFEWSEEDDDIGNHYDVEHNLSGGKAYYLSTSRTKNPDVNSFTKNRFKFTGLMYVRIEIDTSKFKSMPVNYQSQYDYLDSKKHGFEYEERIVSDNISHLSLKDDSIRRIDIYTNDLDSFYEMYSEYTKYSSTSANAKFLKRNLRKAGILNKTFIYNNKTDFIRQTNNTI